jgi:hypothetical protein
MIARRIPISEMLFCLLIIDEEQIKVTANYCLGETVAWQLYHIKNSAMRLIILR